ncbi:MAG: DNA polymerase II large subunit, partial [Candidatus Micrarchaeota archaeon]|nr:DNA polymerase II large subunit [Candidatus Micrarchaeota archaeon]
MDNNEYFSKLSEEFESAYSVAKSARSKGLDPKEYVEIYPAPDLASRVEGLINIEGIAAVIRNLDKHQSKSRLAFSVVEEICKNGKFDSYETIKRIEVAVRVGSAILTDGVLVAPTEGISGIRRYKNPDGTDYIAVMYAGPIRGAGGTAAAQSVALADYARRIFDIGQYKASFDEIERYVEEAELYHSRAARLQYKPPDDDLRVIVSNCPVCVDGVPTENTLEVGVHANLKRTTYDGKEVPITNKVRGGVPLVLCEGIAQKAKKLVKEVKAVGLDWDWLNNIIKVDVKKADKNAAPQSTFLDELVAGRPILAYPNQVGGFRLRYGRSRFTGIAAKGFSPATMILTMGFIAVGTQLKMESAGKGCVASPVDSLEGPFVLLKNGNALRINDAQTAMKYKDQVAKIISIGDILITYGDFKKSNSQLKPTSYVEEYWEAQLKSAGYDKGFDNAIGFDDAYKLSLVYKVPIHPKYLYEFQAVTREDIQSLALELIRNSKITAKNLYEVGEVSIDRKSDIKRTLELLNVPHNVTDNKLVLESDYAKSLIASLGFACGEEGLLNVSELVVDKYQSENPEALALVNKVSPFKIPRRSTYIAARIGRPEKAKERLMKPAPNVLFPISAYGGKDRNITNAYLTGSKKFKSEISIDIANYRCANCKRLVQSEYCYDCGRRAYIERSCPTCGRITVVLNCPVCKTETIAYSKRDIDIVKLVSDANKRLGNGKMPTVIKGVRGMTNKDKLVEPIEKGMIRADNGVYIFKDGTARFDATDVPITHFYPEEMGVSLQKLRELGYTHDCLGNELKDTGQLVEMRHQDVILNVRGADYMLKVCKSVDQMLEKVYGLEPFYNAKSPEDLLGKLVITLSPHTSCGVLNRVIGFSRANVGFAHPYTISARRRNCDGDEDTTMLLLDALINFSRDYLPQTVGGTMDTPLILTINVKPEEVDDEVHVMETVEGYGVEFYDKTMNYPSPSEVKVGLVEDRLGTDQVYRNLGFTHGSSPHAVMDSPK